MTSYRYDASRPQRDSDGVCVDISDENVELQTQLAKSLEVVLP